jgi:hypothetical protein
MKTKYQKIKPKRGDSLLNNKCNGWKIVGTITDVEPSGIVHFMDEKGTIDVFIWIFQAGTSSEHTNRAFKWGKLDPCADWDKELSGIHPNNLINALHAHKLAPTGKIRP